MYIVVRGSACWTGAAPGRETPPKSPCPTVVLCKYRHHPARQPRHLSSSSPCPSQSIQAAASASIVRISSPRRRSLTRSSLHSFVLFTRAPHSTCQTGTQYHEQQPPVRCLQGQNYGPKGMSLSPLAPSHCRLNAAALVVLRTTKLRAGGARRDRRSAGYVAAYLLGEMHPLTLSFSNVAGDEGGAPLECEMQRQVPDSKHYHHPREGDVALAGDGGSHYVFDRIWFRSFSACSGQVRTATTFIHRKSALYTCHRRVRLCQRRMRLTRTRARY